MEINEKVIKIWSTIGPRAAFGMAALDFAKEYEGDNSNMRCFNLSRARQI